MLANVFHKSLFSASKHRFLVFGITIISLVGCYKRAPTMNKRTFIFILSILVAFLERVLSDPLPAPFLSILVQSYRRRTADIDLIVLNVQ